MARRGKSIVRCRMKRAREALRWIAGKREAVTVKRIASAFKFGQVVLEPVVQPVYSRPPPVSGSGHVTFFTNPVGLRNPLDTPGDPR